MLPAPGHEENAPAIRHPLPAALAGTVAVGRVSQLPRLAAVHVDEPEMALRTVRGRFGNLHQDVLAIGREPRIGHGAEVPHLFVGRERRSFILSDGRLPERAAEESPAETGYTRLKAHARSLPAEVEADGGIIVSADRPRSTPA